MRSCSSSATRRKNRIFLSCCIRQVSISQFAKLAFKGLFSSALCYIRSWLLIFCSIFVEFCTVITAVCWFYYWYQIVSNHVMRNLINNWKIYCFLTNSKLTLYAFLSIIETMYTQHVKLESKYYTVNIMTILVPKFNVTTSASL